MYEWIIKKYYQLYNLSKKMYYCLPLKHVVFNKKIVSDNKKYHNMFDGKRCFILANGPSINEENIDLVRGEYIFTVNQMIRKKTFEDLNPICNFWFDPAYFDESMPVESIKNFCSLFNKTCNSNNKIINFVPAYSYKFLQKYSLLHSRVSFVNTSLYYYDGYNGEFDCSGLMPAFQNIVQYAISMAIYMGFKEIYMLGCDSTGIITKINSKLNESIEECYAYDLGKQDQKYVNSLLNYFTIEEQFSGWARTFHLYKELEAYCTRRNIKLVNCSTRTIIEDIPRKPLIEIIKRK